MSRSKKVCIHTVLFYYEQKAKPYIVDMAYLDDIEDDNMRRIELQNNSMIDVTQVRDIFEKIMDSRISNYKNRLLEIKSS